MTQTNTGDMNLTAEEIWAIRRALEAQGNALGALRRMHGYEVAEIALAGLNVAHECNALGILTRHGWFNE